MNEMKMILVLTVIVGVLLPTTLGMFYLIFRSKASLYETLSIFFLIGVLIFCLYPSSYCAVMSFNNRQKKENYFFSENRL